jgi:hypothetical protein
VLHWSLGLGCDDRRGDRRPSEGTIFERIDAFDLDVKGGDLGDLGLPDGEELLGTGPPFVDGEPENTQTGIRGNQVGHSSHVARFECEQHPAGDGLDLGRSSGWYDGEPNAERHACVTLCVRKLA